jgi:hypothetical protein
LCNLESDYACARNFYSIRVVENICPWCIKDGSAANKFDEFGSRFDTDNSVTKYLLEFQSVMLGALRMNGQILGREMQKLRNILTFLPQLLLG